MMMMMMRCGNGIVSKTTITSGAARGFWTSGRLWMAPRQSTKRSFSEFQSTSSSKKSRARLFFEWYSNRLDTHPITTKCISAGLISSFGNVTAQAIAYYEENADDVNSDNELANTKESFWKDFRVNAGQVGRFAFLNVIFVAPVLHHWYNVLNHVLPGTSIKRVLARTFWDEFVFSPIYIPVFLTGLWTLEGTPWPKLKSMIVKEVPGIVVAEWCLWVPTMLVTFRYAPVKFQVLVINVVGVVWQTFLSFMAARAHVNADETQDEKTKEEVDLYLESIVGQEAMLRRNTNKPHITSDGKVIVKATSPVSK